MAEGLVNQMCFHTTSRHFNVIYAWIWRKNSQNLKILFQTLVIQNSYVPEEGVSPQILELLLPRLADGIEPGALEASQLDGLHALHRLGRLEESGVLRGEDALVVIRHGLAGEELG